MDDISPVRRSTRAKEEPPEKRQARFVSQRCQKTKDRIERAVSQRMYLLNQEDVGYDGLLAKKFDVLGSTGNIYTVNSFSMYYPFSCH